MYIKRINLSNILCILFVSALILSLIPILYASFYVHPLYDDFAYSRGVHDAVLNNENILDILHAVFSQVKNTYFTWQGTFSAIFLFSLQPGAFSDNLYFLTTFILIFFLIFSTYFLLDTIIVKWLKSKRTYSLIISSLTLLCQMQFVVSKREAFYWFNGAIYYTLFYSFSLIMFAIIIRLYLAKSRTCKIILCIIASILAIIIGGGNYTTALTTSVILFLSIVVIIKNKEHFKHYYFIILTLLLISLIISIVAPGNSVRAATVNGMSPIKAILMSVFYSLAFMGQWTCLPQIVFLVFITPFLYIISKNSNFNFKYPLIVSIISLLCFASQFTPTLYSMSTVGAGRQRNIYYYSYYLFLIFNIFYICGWINKNHHKYIKIINLEDIKSTKNKILSVFIAGVIFALGCIQFRSDKPTSLEVTLSIINGSIYEYDSEYKKSIEQIKSGRSKIDEIKVNPSFFGNLGIDEDSEGDNFWVNKAISRYYHVDYFYKN